MSNTFRLKPKSDLATSSFGKMRGERHFYLVSVQRKLQKSYLFVLGVEESDEDRGKIRGKTGRQGRRNRMKRERKREQTVK